MRLNFETVIHQSALLKPILIISTDKQIDLTRSKEKFAEEWKRPIVFDGVCGALMEIQKFATSAKQRGENSDFIIGINEFMQVMDIELSSGPVLWSEFQERFDDADRLIAKMIAEEENRLVECRKKLSMRNELLRS
ncbi:hypothetical protein ACOME3_002864 [Neoechinorhynchus agilis]